MMMDCIAVPVSGRRAAGEQEHAGWLVAGAWKDSPEPGKKGGRSEPAIPSQT